MSTLILTLLIGFVCLLCYWYRKLHRFEDWGIPKQQEVPFLGALPINLLRQVSAIDNMKDLYNLNAEAKYVGYHVFNVPVIVLRDVELIKRVFVKDFDHFSDRVDSRMNDAMDPLLAKNLTALRGEQWREMRNLLSPAFTSSKMRLMFELMSKCADNFADRLVEMFGHEPEFDVKEAFSKYTNDVIASCAFGVEVDSLKEPNNEFYHYGKVFVEPPKGFAKYKMLVQVLAMAFLPKVSKMLGWKVMSEEASKFFVNTIESVIKARDEQGISRPDMLQLLMDARGHTSENTKMETVDIAAQGMLFFLAGFEVVANHMSLMAHELAVNPEVQQKLLAEVDRVTKSCADGDVSYEAIGSMAYLDAVFMETERRHPSVPFLSRVCSKPYVLPATLPGAKPYSLGVDEMVNVSVAGIHSDPSIYEEPDAFKPERFLGRKPTSSEPTLLGFSLGPRACIGNRFAILETKVLFYSLLKRCRFERCERTCNPIKYSSNVGSPAPEDGFWLKIQAR